MYNISSFFTGLANVTFHASHPKEPNQISFGEKILAVALAVVSVGFIPLVGYCINRSVHHLPSSEKVSAVAGELFSPTAAAAKLLSAAAKKFCNSIPKIGKDPGVLNSELQEMLLHHAQTENSQTALVNAFISDNVGGSEGKLQSLNEGIPAVFARDAHRAPIIKITTKDKAVVHFNGSPAQTIIDSLVIGLEPKQAITVKAFLNCISQAAMPIKWSTGLDDNTFIGHSNFAYEIDLSNYPKITVTNTFVRNFTAVTIKGEQQLQHPFSSVGLSRIEINCEAQGVAEAAEKFLDPATNRDEPAAMNIAYILMNACTVRSAELLVQTSDYVSTTTLTPPPNTTADQQIPPNVRAFLTRAIGPS